MLSNYEAIREPELLEVPLLFRITRFSADTEIIEIFKSRLKDKLELVTSIVQIQNGT